MQRTIFICALIFYTVAAYSQQPVESTSTASTQQSSSQEETLNQTVNGKRHGKWRIERKGKIDEGEYLNGNKNGEWHTTLADGTLISSVTFDNGVPKGEAFYYYADGTLMEKGYWNVDHWEGDYVRCHPNGNKSCSFTYNENGKRTGRQVYYHENGNVMFEGEWNNGKINGTLSIYNEDGNKIMERNYDASGKYQGTQETPSEATQTSTRDFTQTGQFTLFDGKGRKEQKGKFVNGELVDGEKYIYGDDGKLQKTEVYKNGKLVGTKKAK